MILEANFKDIKKIPPFSHSTSRESVIETSPSRNIGYRPKDFHVGSNHSIPVYSFHKIPQRVHKFK